MAIQFVGYAIICALNAPVLARIAVFYLALLGRWMMSDDKLPRVKTYDKARAAESAGNLEEARRVYRHYLEDDPEDREARRLLAELLMRMDEKVRALRAFRKVVNDSETEEEWCATAFRLAEIYEEDFDRPDRAEKLYRRVIDEYPDGEYARYARSRLEKMAGE